MGNLKTKRMTCARVATAEGEFQLCLYHNNRDAKEHLAFVMGDVAGQEGVLARAHLECFTGDLLGSLRCDCGEQLHQALSLIAGEGQGVQLYLRQEGRGIGLFDKLRAYNLQHEGYDTVDANLILGHQADERDYSLAAAILDDLGVRSVRLLTNNPSQIDRLRALGVVVICRVPLQAPVTSENVGYLFAKANRMNHWLELAALPEPSPAARRNGSGGPS